MTQQYLNASFFADVTNVQSPVRKGAGFHKGRVPGKPINVGTAASKTSPGARALTKLGSSKTTVPPGKYLWVECGQGAGSKDEKGCASHNEPADVPCDFKIRTGIKDEKGCASHNESADVPCDFKIRTARSPNLSPVIPQPLPRNRAPWNSIPWLHSIYIGGEDIGW